MCSQTRNLLTFHLHASPWTNMEKFIITKQRAVTHSQAEVAFKGMSFNQSCPPPDWMFCLYDLEKKTTLTHSKILCKPHCANTCLRFARCCKAQRFRQILIFMRKIFSMVRKLTKTSFLCSCLTQLSGVLLILDYGQNNYTPNPNWVCKSHNPAFYGTQNIFKMFTLRNFTFIFNWMAATCLKRAGTPPCLPLWRMPASFNKLLKTSGNRGEQLPEFWERRVVPFSSDTRF